MNWKLLIKPNGKHPLYRQIENSIRAALDAGQLKPGERIPSVADLAAQLGINKLTVFKAFQRLEKAGLLRSEVGRGSFIASPDKNGALMPVAEPAPEVARSLRKMREGFARSLRELMTSSRRPGTINLSGGVPDPATAPDGILEKLVREAVKRNARNLYEYSGPHGLQELREAVAAMLRARGMTVTPDEILITNGSQEAISITAAWARDEERTALCETPTASNVLGALMLFGHHVQSVGWDGGSPNLERLRMMSAGKRVLFYLCPDFHNPTGLTVPTERRGEIAAWARTTDAVVLVDEIFRDMRFEAEAPPSLYELLPPGRRIMVGSLSKSFMPGLRIGFLVTDRALLNELTPYKRYLDLGGAPLIQAIAAQFLQDGYASHLEKIRPFYRVRRDAALAALQRTMPKGVTWTRPQGGFQLWVSMPPGISSVQLFIQAAEKGVSMVPGPAHDIDGRYLNCFRLGYAHGTPEDINEGVSRLADVIQSLLAHTPAEPGASGLGILV